MFWQGRKLEWYGVLVHNQSVVGSLFTLLHLPFLFAFLSMVLIGTIAGGAIDLTVLLLSLMVVALLLYGEHMLDDTTLVGKPWGTVFSDQALFSMAVVLFVVAGGIGLIASIWLKSPLPFLGVLIGVLFSTLYGLEVWKFHTVGFGAVGMGIIPAFSYLAQSITTGFRASIPIIALLTILGCTYTYVMLSLYEHTKTDSFHESWKLLGYHLITVYALSALVLVVRFEGF